MITNLLSNAIKFSAENTKIIITIEPAQLILKEDGTENNSHTERSIDALRFSMKNQAIKEKQLSTDGAIDIFNKYYKISQHPNKTQL